jgi:hypothetical protein
MNGTTKEKAMKALEMDTIYWEKERVGFETIFTSGIYMITKTKFKEFRLVAENETVDIYPTLNEAKQAAEIDKQVKAFCRSQVN